MWKNTTHHKLLAFARRQDNDDLAGFNVLHTIAQEIAKNTNFIQRPPLQGWPNTSLMKSIIQLETKKLHSAVIQGTIPYLSHLKP